MNFTGFEEADIKLEGDCERNILKQRVCPLLTHTHIYTTRNYRKN